MKYTFFKFIPVFFVFVVIGCGSDDGSSANEESSFSESSSSVSSSSYSNRLDVTYADTLSSDTLKISSNKDSLVTSYKLFLGEYPQGTFIHLISKKSGGFADSLYVREEQGSILYPEYFMIDDSGDTTYNAQTLFSRLGDGEYKATKFVTTEKSGFYYVDIPNVSFDKDSSYTIRIAANVMSNYFDYVGDTANLSISLGDTLRGVFVIGESAKNAKATFTASTGKSINVNANGRSISEIVLKNGKTEMASGSFIDEQILPETSGDYSITITPVDFRSYMTGYYAYFTIATTSRNLGKGEYFALPDSIQKVGDTLTIVRERNDAAKYYLRQEEYVWLADLEKNDTVNVFHSIEGYYSGASYPATYAILNDKGDSVAAISGSQPKFVAPSKGAYYLHYVRLNAPPSDSSQKLTLHTLLQRLHYVNKIYFFDEEKDKSFDSKNAAIGSTFNFSDITLRIEPTDVANYVLWYTPCDDLANIKSAYSIENCKLHGTEQLLSAMNIVISEKAEAGNIIHLIAESKADPIARDTLSIVINE